MTRHHIEWIDHGREPQCAPNPDYPDGIHINTVAAAGAMVAACTALLPYPAKRCGLYIVRCKVCGTSVAVITAGRRDDPRSVRMACDAARKAAN